MDLDLHAFQKEVIERLTELRGDVKTIRSQLAEDYKILHGNGQPGLISRITILENNFWWIKWLSGIVGAVIGFVASVIFTRILG